MRNEEGGVRNSIERNATSMEFLTPLSSFLIVSLGILACTAAPSPSPGIAPGRALRIEFVPESETFAAAVGEYERIWATDAARIVRAMQDVSGLVFTDSAITAIVFEGVSSSGFRDTPMRLRASYPLDTKKATLIHELGHRLQSPLFRRQDEEHGPLFLWLYDVWVALYGKEFADAQVLVEKRRRGPYPRAWDEALSLSPGERAQRWKAIIANQRARQ